jgi:hypothetical protein
MLAMGYTGTRAMLFKETYIKAFNQMHETISKRLYAQQLPMTSIKAKVKPQRINGRVMFPYRDVQRVLGYSTKGSLDNVRRKFEGLLVTIGRSSFVAEEYVQVMIARATARHKAAEAEQISLTNPVLGLDFGQSKLAL